MNAGIISVPSVMDIFDVKEMFSRFPVDPDLAQRNVRSKWKVKIHEDEQARLLVMVQECRKMVLDYVLNVGYVGMSQVWIELEGPEEFVTPLPSTTPWCTRSLASLASARSVSGACRWAGSPEAPDPER
ncbi:MAG: hypothetical protein PVH50_10900 [Anaerolineae bacterium]